MHTSFDFTFFFMFVIYYRMVAVKATTDAYSFPWDLNGRIYGVGFGIKVRSPGNLWHTSPYTYRLRTNICVYFITKIVNN